MNTRFYLYMWNGSYKEPASFTPSYYMRFGSFRYGALGFLRTMSVV